jgi:hypothetical protein
MERTTMSTSTGGDLERMEDISGRWLRRDVVVHNVSVARLGEQIAHRWRLDHRVRPCSPLASEEETKKERARKCRVGLMRMPAFAGGS